MIARGGRWWIALGAAALAAVPAAAHDFWLEPSSFTPAAGSVVAVRLLVGEHFHGEAVPRNPEAVVRFDLLTPDGGREEVLGAAGWEPAGRVRVAAPGLHTLIYRSTPSPVTLPADRFEAYLKLEGLEAVIAARAARGASGEPGREIFSRCAKALVEAQPAVPGKGRDRPAGLTLELVAEADPYHLGAPGSGAELPVRLLYRGEPLAGALVVALAADTGAGAGDAGGDASAVQSVRSDHAGRAVFHLDHPGPWLVKAVHMIAAPPGSGADWESLWASLTFAVPSGGGPRP